eukprot:TRINITY_DN5452_c0_g1_i3.p1 TRINITY_DN5452_c0_g1~~TRINITY_DN5452_c0_g1_i3.p1  ORF type:complete len:221 (+),score=45.88 TRINITY_DN5452_c0_g1_i3:48-710(+)
MGKHNHEEREHHHHEEKKKRKPASDLDAFLPRPEKLAKMTVPDTSENTIVVKPNNEALGFKTNCYEQRLKNFQVAKDTFDATVRECTRICESVWRMKKDEETAEYRPYLRYLLIFATLLVVVSFYLLTHMMDNDPENHTLLFGALVAVGIAILIAVYVIVTAKTSKPSFVNLEVEILAKLKEFLNAQNTTVYSSKGLEWWVQDQFYWLELRIRNPRGSGF